MIVEASLRSLFRRRSRTALALAGIAVSAALLLDMTMLASGLTHSFRELTRSQGYSLRVTPRGTLPFDSEAGIRNAAEVRQRIMTMEEVSAVAPVLGAQLYAVTPDSVGQPIFTSGIDPASQMIYLLLEGSEPGPEDIVISRALAGALSLTLGDTLPLSAELDVTLGRPRSVRTARVSGFGDFFYDSAGQHSIAMPLETLQALAGRPDEVTFLAIAGRTSADEEALALRIEQMIPAVSAYSNAELTEAMDQRLVYFRQLSTILGTIALLVAILLVGTIVTIGVRERFHEIATMRAIGVPATRLQLAIVVEGVTLTALGCLLGVPFGLWMAERLDRILLSFPGIPARVSFFVFQPGPAAVALGTVLVAGALAGVLPGRMALRAPLGAALREEAD